MSFKKRVTSAPTIDMFSSDLDQFFARFPGAKNPVFLGAKFTENDEKAIAYFPNFYQAEKVYRDYSKTISAFFKKPVEYRWDETNWNKPRCAVMQDDVRHSLNPDIYYNSDCKNCGKGYGCNR